MQRETTGSALETCVGARALCMQSTKGLCIVDLAGG